MIFFFKATKFWDSYTTSDNQNRIWYLEMRRFCNKKPKTCDIGFGTGQWGKLEESESVSASWKGLEEIVGEDLPPRNYWKLEESLATLSLEVTWKIERHPVNLWVWLRSFQAEKGITEALLQMVG